MIKVTLRFPIRADRGRVYPSSSVAGIKRSWLQASQISLDHVFQKQRRVEVGSYSQHFRRGWPFHDGHSEIGFTRGYLSSQAYADRFKSWTLGHSWSNRRSFAP